MTITYAEDRFTGLAGIGHVRHVIEGSHVNPWNSKHNRLLSDGLGIR